MMTGVIALQMMMMMSGADYRQQMELLLLRVGLREEERTSISRFLSGLNMEMRDKVKLLPYRDLVT